MSFQDIVKAAVAQNICVYDDRAAPGNFTRRLFVLMKQVARRNTKPVTDQQEQDRVHFFFGGLPDGVDPVAYEKRTLCLLVNRNGQSVLGAF